MVYCRKCGTELNEKARFCHICGEEVIFPRCSTCGSNLKGSEKFCPQCGASTSFVPLNISFEDSNRNVQKYKQWGIISALVVAILLLFGSIRLLMITQVRNETLGQEQQIAEQQERKEETSYEVYEPQNEEDSYNQSIDISPILYECQNEITAIQREIEDACRTFAILSSQDIDIFKYAQMKSTFLEGVSSLERKADKAFDKCARQLKDAGYPDAVEKINEEKRNFHSAIYGLTTRTTQQVDNVVY